MHYGRNFKLSFHLSPRWDQVIPSLALALDTVLPYGRTNYWGLMTNSCIQELEEI